MARSVSAPLCFAAMSALLGLGGMTPPLLAQEATPDQGLSPAELKEVDGLVARGLCLSCHQEPLSRSQVPYLPGPTLDDVDGLLSPEWVEAWLRDPQALHPGTRMPSMLASLPEEERPQVAADLRAYLRVSPFDLEWSPVEASPQMLEEGERLFQEIGCMACHEQDFADRSFSRKTTVDALQDFLLGPMRHRPSGMMPDMSLTEDESLALAAWILREQAGSGELESLPGLHWQAYAWDGVGNGPSWEEQDVFAQGTALTLDADYGGREDLYGLVFTGTWHVQESANYTVYLGSDDGNRLLLDGEVVLDARVNQSHTRHQVTLPLEQGPHEFRLEYYENSGDASLEAGWILENGEDHPFGAADFSHHGALLRPLPMASSGLDGDPEQGSFWYGKLRCQACHEGSLPMRGRLPSWSQLRPLQGCLADTPKPLAPTYTWTTEERALLRKAVQQPEQFFRDRDSREMAEQQVQMRNCVACHAWPDVGGPSAAQQKRFRGEGDLGEEGRVPPSLEGVAAKLQPHWLRQVVIHGKGVRPYMHTRMPAYGGIAGSQVVNALQQLAPPPRARPERAFDANRVEMGRQLAGLQGFACISCHQFAGHRSNGIQGLDLVTVRERLRPEWFQAWLRNPHEFRQQTRMPVFWNEQGQSAITKWGDGEAQVQIPALWDYLSLGASAPLPPGLLIEGEGDLQVPTDRPLYFGTFMAGLSARVLTVGFPERVNLAFDEHHVRLAKVWKGDFMRTAGTWNGRAGQLEEPAGSEVLDLPPGPPFAVLEPGQDWPTLSGKEAGWRMHGHRRDAQGYPTFRYRWGSLEVEEHLRPVMTAYGTVLRREFLLQSPVDLPGLQWQHLRRSSNLPWEAVTFTREGDLFVARLSEDLSW